MNTLDWDNLRFFLAVARKGSLRSGAVELNVNHGTVNRRIAAFEQQLGERLFERLPTGYVLTSAGEKILSSAERVEKEVHTLRRESFAQNVELSGELRITLPQPLVTHLLMPDLSLFTKQYPGIDLEIISSYTELNLTKREADVAIRLTDDMPPGHLIGRKLLSYCSAAYVSKSYLEECNQNSMEMKWIIKDDEGPLPNWVGKTGYAKNNRHYFVNDMSIQLAATRAGMGASVLPCLVADQDQELQRLSPKHPYPTRDIWILTHRDLRDTPRIRTFIHFITKVIHGYKDLIEGREY